MSVSNTVMLQVVLHCNMLLDRGEKEVIQADQVLHGNRIPGHPGIGAVIHGDADMNKKNTPFDGLESCLFFSWSKRASSGRARLSPLSVQFGRLTTKHNQPPLHETGPTCT